MKHLMHSPQDTNPHYLFKIEGNESAEVSTTLEKLKGLEAEIGGSGIYAAMEAAATGASQEELQGYLQSLREAFDDDDLDTVAKNVTMKVEKNGTSVSFIKKEAAQPTEGNYRNYPPNKL